MLDTLTFDAGSTLTPDYMLMLDSRDITGNISDRLMSMTLTDNRGFEADQLDIMPTGRSGCRFVALS